MRLYLVITLVVFLQSIAAVQTLPDRQFIEGKLLSRADPPVELKMSNVGGQVIDIFNVAGAEQHFFVDAAPDSSIRRFYWIQFEHYYSSNQHVYDYSGIKQQPVQFDSLDFLGDISVVPDYFTSANREGSDSKAGQQFLLAHGYKIDGTFVRLRLFHLPDTTRRKELMIIYGESVSSRVSEKSIKSEIIQHAREYLKIQLNH